MMRKRQSGARSRVLFLRDDVRAAYAMAREAARRAAHGGTTLLECDGGSVSLAGADYESGVRVCVSHAEHEGAGRCLLPPFVGDILRWCEAVSIRFGGGGDDIELQSGDSSWRLPSRDPDEYPSPTADRPEMVVQCSVHAGALRAALRRAASAAPVAPSGVLPAGLVFCCSDGDLVVVGVRGCRLAIARCSLVSEAAGWPADVLVPLRALSLFERCLAAVDAERRIFVETDGRRLWLHTAEFTSWTGLLEGKAPPWQTVVPEKWDAVEVDGAALREGVRLASVTAWSESPCLDMSLSRGALVLRAASEVGQSHVQLEVSGDEKWELSVSPDYLADFLAAAGDVRFRLGVHQKNMLCLQAVDETVSFFLMALER